MKKLLLILTFFLSFSASAQKPEIQWMEFEELDDSLRVETRPVLIYFYTDWCAYCKKMERHAFKDDRIIREINERYYAVKMNAETTENIEFEGQVFGNPEAKHKRRGIHQIPQLIASREGKPMSFPVLLVLDTDFSIKKRSFEYLTSDRMKELIGD